MSINTPLNSAMIVLDNKSLRKERFPFWIFDVLHSFHNVNRNFIPLIDAKHKSSDCVRYSTPFHFLVTFLFLQALMYMPAFLGKICLELVQNLFSKFSTEMTVCWWLIRIHSDSQSRLKRLSKFVGYRRIQIRLCALALLPA